MTLFSHLHLNSEKLKCIYPSKLVHKYVGLYFFKVTTLESVPIVIF